MEAREVLRETETKQELIVTSKQHPHITTINNHKTSTSMPSKVNNTQHFEIMTGIFLITLCRSMLHEGLSQNK